MMGGRGPMPCRFGVDCHRRDCWYSHPAGRAIDARAGGGEDNNRANSASNGLLSAASGGSRAGRAPPGGGGMMMPQASPRMGGGGGRGGGGGSGRECRYSFECTRRDCHFSHPLGRAIDSEGGGGGGGGGGGRPSLNRPPSNNSIGSLTRGMSEISFGDYPPANATDDDQDLKDTWFPKARDCTCCKGFVYGCTSEICESMGQCTCSIEEKDLDGGGGSDVSSNISRTSSPQVGMGTNGGFAGAGTGEEWVRPPQPPTEEAMAAAAGAGAGAGGFGGRASSGGRGGGAAECRYGKGCKRANCSFNHPQGRNMDANGSSSFRGGGGGAAAGRSAAATAQAQQDLMDTWFPDCRECACCKGYKHGCKTPACAAAGLCACSSGDGPAAPISAVSSPPASSPSEVADAKPAAAGEGAAGAAEGGGAETGAGGAPTTAQATA